MAGRRAVYFPTLMQIDSPAPNLSAGEQPLLRVRYVFSCDRAPELLWRVRRVELVEELSQPYQLTIDLLIEDAELDPDQILAADCELRIERDGVDRCVCGIVARVELHDRLEDQFPVRLTIVPALRLLEQRVDTRLWQGMSALAIVEEVLAASFGDYQRELDTERLQGDYTTREYVVQYHESDLAFVSRLLEDEGIAYHFEHERGTGREVMVLEDGADHWEAVPTLDDSPTLAIIATRQEQAEVESIQRLTWERSLRPNTVTRQTFDWLDPTSPTTAQTTADETTGPSREIYNHGRIVEADPQPRVVRELAHLRAGARVLRGTGNAIGLAPGRRFRVSAPERPELEREFLVVRSSARGDCPDVQLGEEGGDLEFVTEFECVPFTEEPWRPPLRTPMPKIHGPQTALVTGPEGEEIHTDQHGRIKVRFDWDRQHGLTDDTSMWIRVAHGWAGAGFGVLFTPRVGMEVVVEFIGGDPDRPLVTGCVHNGDAATPVALPDAKTQSTIRTKSSPGGEGFNELRFEDAAGAEEIFVHAQRDLRETIHRNQTTSVGVDRSETIGRDHQHTVRGDQTLTVEKTRTETVVGDEHVRNKAKRSTVIDGDEWFQVFGHTASFHQSSFDQRVTGTLKSQVFRPQTGKALSDTWVEGELSLDVDEQAKMRAGHKFEINQGKPASEAHISLEKGKIHQLAMTSWTAMATEHVTLESQRSAWMFAAKDIKLAQGRATVLLAQDEILFEASRIRLVVGENMLTLDESGLEVAVTSIKMTARDDVTITGAKVDVD